jgi:hypothetical protein
MVSSKCALALVAIPAEISTVRNRSDQKCYSIERQVRQSFKPD